MLKSIGMTPSEVTGMMVTSMAELGVAGTLIGLPLGILARLVMAAITHSAFFVLPAHMINVWSAALVAALAFSGLVIAILGAYVPPAPRHASPSPASCTTSNPHQLRVGPDEPASPASCEVRESSITRDAKSPG